MANTKITNHIVDKTFITGQTAVTAADGDYLLVSDASDSGALKKVLASDLIQTSEEVQDLVGAMFTSNTESGITVAYQDSDGTVDFTVGAAQSSITSLGTLSALTISGDLIVDTDTLKVTSGSDLVHIGNTSTGFHSSVHPLIVGSGSGDEGMAIFSGSSNKGKIGFADAASDDSGSYRGYIQYDHNGDKMNIGTAGGTRMHINDAGDVGIGTDTLNKFFNLADPNEGAETLKLHFEAAASTDSWAIYPYDRTNSHYPNLHLGANAAIKVKNTGAVDMISSTLYVHQDGKVGIGTTSPGESLHVKRADGTALIVESSNDQNNTGDRINIEFRTDASMGIAKIIGGKEGNYQAAGLRSGYLAFQTINANSYAERMRISSNGGLNIGTTSGASGGGIQTYVADNDEAVDCEGPGRVNFTINSDESGGNRWYFRTAGSGNFGSGNGDLLVLREDGTQIMKWDLSAMTIVGDFDDTSDVALKENIIDITDATAKIKALQPRTFDWKDKNKTQGTNGFIAQEVETVLPKLVHGDNYDPENPHHGHKAINTSGLLAVAIKAIQELSTKLEAAEARITTLEG